MYEIYGPSKKQNKRCGAEIKILKVVYLPKLMSIFFLS